MRTNTWVAGVVFLCLVLGGCVSQGKYLDLEKKYVERGESLARANAILDEYNERVNFLTVDLKAKERLLEKREEELALAASVSENVAKDIQATLAEKLKDIEGDFSRVFKVDEGVTYNAKTGALILEGEVFFDSGSAKIKKAAEKTLLKVARMINDKA
ncbi:MAG: OmpA family protein, partial [Planctomycetota bacterium]